MKILWFVNRYFPAVSLRLDRGAHSNGYWMSELGEVLAKQDNLELSVVTVSSSLTAKEIFKADGITYYCLPTNSLINNTIKWFKCFSPARKFIGMIFGILPVSNRKELEICQRIVNEVSPDVVHFHGTEPFYGLLSEYIFPPAIVSIQGILSECLKEFWGGINWLQRFLLPVEIYRWLIMWKKSKRERTIYRVNSFFTGRTLWDKQHQSHLNPSGHYYHCGEVLRPIFFQKKWVMEGIQRNCIYTTTTSLPYKGTACLIEAVAILKPINPDILLRIGGPIPTKGYGKYLRNIVKKFGIEKNVQFIGALNEVQIANELVQAHIYVLPSYIENSPNTVAEAQLVGVPCVASYVGGLPSMVSEGKTGLLFPKGDAAVLAGCINRIFKDDSLARHLSINARVVASKRHDPFTIVRNLLSIYEDIINRHNDNKL